MSMHTPKPALKKYSEAFDKAAKGISGNNPYGDMFGNVKPKSNGGITPSFKKAPKSK